MKHLSRTALCGFTFLLLAGTAMANPPGDGANLLNAGATAAGQAVSSPVNVNPGPAEIPTGEFHTNMPSLSGGPSSTGALTDPAAVEIPGALAVAAPGMAVTSGPINVNPGPVDIPTGDFHTNMPELSGGPTPPATDLPTGPTGPVGSVPGSVGGISPGG